MDENLTQFETLSDENKRLKAKNDKLYKDCVAFAKKIKGYEEIDSKIAALEKENENLKAEIEELNASLEEQTAMTAAAQKAAKAAANKLANSEPVIQETVTSNSKFKIKTKVAETFEPEEIIEEQPEIPESDETIEEIAEETTDNFFDQPVEIPTYDANPTFETSPYAVPEQQASDISFANLKATDDYIAPVDVAGDVLPKNHNTHKNSRVRTFFRAILWICLIFSFIIGAISSVTYLFSTAYADYGIANYRFSCVKNSNLSPTYTQSDVILIKYSDFNGIEIGSPVVTTKDGLSVGYINSVDVKDGAYIATITDKNESYEVNKDQFYGQVVFKIPYLAKVVAYASANPYYYLAYVVGANLICIALLLIIPSNKAKAPKFGKDYDVEDFTI